MIAGSSIGRTLCLTALAALFGAAGAAIYDFNAEPLPGQTYTTALFRIYVPDEAQVLRGVYFYVNPLNSDSRYIVGDPHLRGLCADEQIGLMGARLDHVQMESGIGQAVLRALDAFADSSGHEELRHSPLFFDGWSWGGQFAYHFTKWLPERVIGFMTMKGGYHDTTFAGDAIEVPGYLFIGELDLPYRITNLTGIFEAHRPLGARWALAMEPGAGHQRIEDRALLDPYVRRVLAVRLPAVITPGEPVLLRGVPEPASYLGDRESHAIGYYACYTGDPGRASWCPSRETAVGWQAFVSDSAVTDTIPCAPAGVGPQPLAQEENRMRAAPNPHRGETELILTLPPGRRARISIHDADGRLVRRWAPATWDAGCGRIRWDGRAQDGRVLPAGVYWARCRWADDATELRLVRLPAH